jgi:class 3 adenylate cyclase
MSLTRHLAAIMFTDIVGYTALMGNDEKKAFELLNKNRQIQKPIIEQYNGRWIKELGDGVMASFSTASDATWNKPMAGFYSLGEFGKVDDSPPQFHGTTVSWVALKEKLTT